MTGTNTKGIVAVIILLVVFIKNSAAQAGVHSISGTNHEKIYIHFDRPYYTAGESIWFKAYLYNNGLPSVLSDELYLQLEDMQGRILVKNKYPIMGAAVPGNIILNDTLAQGYYTIKAVTKNIAAEGREYIYSRNLFIFNQAGITKNGSAKKVISLKFFPESGHLIDRIRTQIAFKAMDENGNPLSINGVIKSDSNTVVTTFKTFHDGIGKFSFTPHITDSLFAETEVNGIKHRFSLPVIESSGVNLKIADADSGKIFTVTRSKKDQDSFDSVRLVVRMNYDTVFENIIAFENDLTLSGTLSTKNINSGILHFIVFDKKGMPLAERLSFVNNHEYLSQPAFAVIKRDSSKRSENSFSLLFNDTIQRSLSIAVTDIAVQDYPDMESICSKFLLTSDLKGYIYNAGYYFEKNDTAHREALDNLMLTHGWTRYDLKKSATVQKNNIDENHFLLSVSGTVNDRSNGKPVPAGLLSLSMMMEDSSFQSVDIAVDKNGRFRIDSLLFFGKTKIFYNYVSAPGKRLQVNLRIDEDNSGLFSFLSSAGIENKIIEQQITENGIKESPTYLSNQFFEKKYKQLSTVFLKTTLKRPEDRINEKYASPLFRGSGKIILDNMNDPAANQSIDIINYVLTNVYNLGYDKDYNSLVNKKNFSMQTQKNWIVELLVDEKTSNFDNAKTIPLEKVALIKFYEAGFVGVSSQAPGGALAVYLKKFDDQQPEPNNQKYIVINGYPVIQEFYSPDCHVPAKTNTIPDTRSTLYWNTSVSSSKEIKYTFFNNDVSKKLSVIVEGFDARGKLIHIEKILD